MTSEPRDETLARPFEELRRADAEKAPPFESMWRAPSKARRVSAWWVAGPAFSALAAAAALALWVGLHRSAEPAPSSAPVAAAASPSPATASAVAVGSNPSLEPLLLDFLLEQPSLASMPDFDSQPRSAEKRR